MVVFTACRSLAWVTLFFWVAYFLSGRSVVSPLVRVVLERDPFPWPLTPWPLQVTAAFFVWVDKFIASAGKRGIRIPIPGLFVIIACGPAGGCAGLALSYQRTFKKAVGLQGWGLLLAVVTLLGVPFVLQSFARGR
mmetsp:Transcript_16940/g.34369  ORF Transcript_16940/g.34369 Transcript_16940/m.34369 type:complete len:136 (-) Transcript_16940:178-585(-)